MYLSESVLVDDTKKMENYRRYVIQAEQRAKDAEENAEYNAQSKARLSALLQRIADARARSVLEDEARVAADKAHEAEMAAMDSEHAKKIEALQKQLDEAKQHLAAARSEKDYLHWSCQVHGIMSNLELAKQH